MNAVKISAGGSHTLALLNTNVTVAGTLTLSGLAAAAPAQAVTFTFRDGNGATLFTRTANIGTNGAFSFTAPAGTYTVHINAAGYLSRNVTLTASGSSVTLNATLLAGDANGDNAIDITDLQTLIAHYNQTAPAADYSQSADFNADGANDIMDLLLLIADYNQVGDN